jgi:hypothetical protein
LKVLHNRETRNDTTEKDEKGLEVRLKVSHNRETSNNDTTEKDEKGIEVGLKVLHNRETTILPRKMKRDLRLG